MKFQRRKKHPILEEVIMDLVGFALLALFIFLMLTILPC